MKNIHSAPIGFAFGVAAGAFVLLAGCKSHGSAGESDGGARAGGGEMGAAPLDASSGAGSCRVFSPAGHALASCIDYVGTDYTAANTPSVCTTNVRSGPSEYAPAPCPSNDRVGSCAVNPGTSVATIWRYYSPGSEGAQSGCAAAGGSWKAN